MSTMFVMFLLQVEKQVTYILFFHLIGFHGLVPAHARAPSLAQRMANVQDQETLSALDAKIQRVVTCE